jgi:hypothetical protein
MDQLGYHYLSTAPISSLTRHYGVNLAEGQMQSMSYPLEKHGEQVRRNFLYTSLFEMPFES